MKKQLRLLLVLTLSIIASCIVSAQSDSVKADIPNYKGLVVTLGYWPHHSSLAESSVPQGTGLIIGIGYLLNNHLQASLKIHSGSESIPEGPERPLWGRMLSGGAGLDLSYTVHGFTYIAPYITAGFDVYTILEGGWGYMANGPRVAIGGRFFFLRHLSMDAGFMMSHLRFYSTYGEISSPREFEQFHSTFTGFTLAVSFYPDFLP